MLNRQILSLFPLALPPHSLTHSPYAEGIAFILPIYTTFEACLRRAIGQPGSSGPATPLHEIYLPALERAHRLDFDLDLLGVSARGGEEKYPRHLQSILNHIESVTAEKPYLLLAYTWILYLAIFSGGRYLRAQLRRANAQAWDIGQDSDASMQFWCFEGDQDGEDIKSEFKIRFGSASTLLTDRERKEVVDEAMEIMKRMIEVVTEIESAFRDQKASPQPDDAVSITTQLLLLRVFLPFSLLKAIGAWSWRFASGFGLAFGLWDPRNAPVA